MGEEPVPVVLAADLVERPVGLLGVDEDDPGLAVPVVGVRPDVEVAERAVRVGPGRLEPGVGVAGVVDDQVGDDPDAALVRLVDQFDEIPDLAELRQDRGVVGDVVAAVAQRRLVEWAAARCSRCPATAGSPAGTSARAGPRCRRRWSRGNRGPAPHRTRRACTTPGPGAGRRRTSPAGAYPRPARTRPAAAGSAAAVPAAVRVRISGHCVS